MKKLESNNKLFEKCSNFNKHNVAKYNIKTNYKIFAAFCFPILIALLIFISSSIHTIIQNVQSFIELGDEYKDYLETLPFGYSNFVAPGMAIFYLFSILIGKKLMNKIDKPFNILLIIKIYNIFQILANLVIIYIGLIDTEFVTNVFFNITGNNNISYNAKCKLILLAYSWCIIKISDFLDTWFFILRKKNDHITFLHAYHHMSTMLLSYVVFRYLPVEQAAVAALINSIIHIIMYTYYFLSSMGYHPSWKKIVTLMQILQFVIILFANLILAFMQTKKKYFWFSCYLIFQCGMYIFLFLNFYYKTYVYIKTKKD